MDDPHKSTPSPPPFPWQLLPWGAELKSTAHHVLDTRRQVGRLLGRLDVSSPRKVLLFMVCLGVAALAYFQGLHVLDESGARGLFILVLAATLWITEATPAFAVSILVIGLEVMLLARPGSASAPNNAAWQAPTRVLGHPLIWLFFGGFVLAAGTERSGLDRTLARIALLRFGTRPPALLAGVMCVTFGFSAFMSNTAATALMLALLAPVREILPENEPFKRSLLLGTAVAANLGGMASLIGTPPNAIAAGLLAPLPGQRLDFLGWLGFGLPLASALAILCWLLLLRLHRTKLVTLDLRPHLTSASAGTDGSKPEPPLWSKITVAVVGLSTVGLWMTGSLHPLPTTVVSLLPIVTFTTLGVLSPTDIRGLPWDVLFLLAGGLVLGDMVKRTGVANWLVSSLPTETLGIFGIALLMGYVSILLSNFMSNTAAANILLPIGVSLAAGSEARVALPIALSASAAMCLPIATPPNALVYATGSVQTGHLLRVGLVLTAVTPALSVLWVWLLR